MKEEHSTPGLEYNTPLPTPAELYQDHAEQLRQLQAQLPASLHHFCHTLQVINQTLFILYDQPDRPEETFGQLKAKILGDVVLEGLLRSLGGEQVEEPFECKLMGRTYMVQTDPQAGGLAIVPADH